MWNIIKFELKYRLGRPATYIYFIIMLGLSFLFTATDLMQASGGGGKVMDNAPVQIAIIMMLMMWVGLLICSSVMGVPVIRDFEHNFDPLIFSTPIKKWQYLGGRFVGSFVILLLIISGILPGLMIGISIEWPWLDTPPQLLPFNVWHFIHPFLVFIVPGLLIFGALFFAAGALGKRMIVVYAQAIIAFMGYLISIQLLGQLDNRNIAALLDPMGIAAYSVLTQYWTVTEQNTQVIPLEGLVLYNRLIWLGVGLLAMILTFVRFNFSRRRADKKQRKTIVQSVADLSDSPPKTSPRYGWKTNLYQVLNLTVFYYKWVLKQLPFAFIVLAGLIFVFILGFMPGSGGYDIDTYATSASVARKIGGSFTLFFFILIVFYSGELIWKERDVRMSLIYDALPHKDFVSLLGKFFGYQLVQATLLMILIVCGVIIQMIKGNNVIEPGLYFAFMFGNVFTSMFLISFMAFFFQVLVNQKFLGFAVTLLFYLSMLVISNLGIEHNLLVFASGSLGGYSEMNKFGHFFEPFNWFRVYWLAFVLLLMVGAIMLVARGAESAIKSRLRTGVRRLTRPVLTFATLSIVLFLTSGFYIFYNTNVLNEYANSEETKQEMADYEKTLSKFGSLVQPKITDTKLHVEIYPSERDFIAEGTYVLANKSDLAINELHIQKVSGNDFETTLTAENVQIDTVYENFGYVVYQLDQPMQPGDEMTLEFEVKYTTVGFKEGRSNTRVIYNGTFFNNNYFPSIGYNDGFELSDDEDREKFGLPVKERMLKRDDPKGVANNLFGDDADKITFEITVGTDSSQIALAPGYLERQWTEGGRTYFHYKMDKPMVNFYSIVSAEYEMKRDVWEAPVDTLDDVNLEIYYHQGHEYNLDRMMKGMKKSLDYYTANFSPYQYRQMRIMEFPAYASFAQSYANTVPFSEAIGFVQKITEKDVDLPFYVTAHEIAHQWWGHQVTEAGVRGNAMLSETLSQYSALMVMKSVLGEEQIRRFLRYELNSYLSGRTFERKKEMPIEKVESQNYIHYRKGSLLMYALQDYISEDSVNAALRRYIRDWSDNPKRYATSRDLIGYLDEVTPDSLSYLIDDFFRTITLYENKTEEATYTVLENGQYQLDLTLSSIKYRADSLGNEQRIGIGDYIEIGVTTLDEEGEEKFIYKEKHLISEETTRLSLIVDQKPHSAGIDPVNKLIDRNPRDNTKKPEEIDKSTSVLSDD